LLAEEDMVMLIVSRLNDENLPTYILGFLTAVIVRNHHFLFLKILGGV
jgi:hypothetical protein